MARYETDEEAFRDNASLIFLAGGIILGVAICAVICGIFHAPDELGIFIPGGLGLIGGIIGARMSDQGSGGGDFTGWD